MNKILFAVLLGTLAVGCASSADQDAPTTDTLTSQYAKYQIVDQEFDNLSVPNDHYDRVPSYEEQLNGSSYIQSSVSQKKNTKPNREMTVQKTVVDSQGNVLSGSSKNGITDQEVLTDEAE